jgi:hypothetical protein
LLRGIGRIQLDKELAKLVELVTTQAIPAITDPSESKSFDVLALGSEELPKLFLYWSKVVAFFSRLEGILDRSPTRIELIVA